MKHPSYTLFLKCQASLFGGILICIFLQPEGLTANDGISYYSGYGLTILPYAVGLLLTAWYVFKISQLDATIRTWCRIIAALLFVSVIIPYALNDTFRELHSLVSGILFLVQFAFAIWQFTKKPDALNNLLIASLFLSILLTLFYLSPRVGYLIVGEVLFQALFGAITYRTLFAHSQATSPSPYDYRIVKRSKSTTQAER